MTLDLYSMDQRGGNVKLWVLGLMPLLLAKVYDNA